MPDTETLYASENLTVIRRAPHASSTLVVTFQSFIDAHVPHHGGFGEQFLDHNGFDAIHVTSSSNAWYQYPDMAAALEAVRAGAGPATRVTYGLSMGAYAAARFAGDVGARRAIAISPQFSIDPRRVPFERRWAEFGDKLAFTCDWPAETVCGHADKGPEVAAIYDPHNLDRRHVALIAAHRPVRHVPVPYGGHPVTALLNEAGLLPSLILDLLHDRYDDAAFAAALAERSPRTAAYHAVQADSLPRREKARRLALHRRAAELAPDDRHIQRGFGIMLDAAGHHAEALEQLQRCLDGYPNDPFTAQAVSKALSHTGRPADAVAAAEAAVRLSGGRIAFIKNLETMRRRERVARWLRWVPVRLPSGPRAP